MTPVEEKLVQTDLELTRCGHQKITQAELIKMFGETIPIEAAKLLFEAPDGRTVGELRSKLREIAALRNVIVIDVAPGGPDFIAAAIVANPSWHRATLTHADVDLETLGELIYEALVKAVAAEREACAMLANYEAQKAGLNCSGCVERERACEVIAAAIRGRSADPKP